MIEKILGINMDTSIVPSLVDESKDYEFLDSKPDWFDRFCYPLNLTVSLYQHNDDVDYWVGNSGLSFRTNQEGCSMHFTPNGIISPKYCTELTFYSIGVFARSILSMCEYLNSSKLFQEEILPFTLVTNTTNLNTLNFRDKLFSDLPPNIFLVNFITYEFRLLELSKLLFNSKEDYKLYKLAFRHEKQPTPYVINPRFYTSVCSDGSFEFTS